MRIDARQARERFASARVARLATVDEQHRPHLVPIVFAVLSEVIYFVVDDKPKSGPRLRRLINIEQNAQVSLIVDHYAEDWNELWWARADGSARVLTIDDTQDDAQASTALAELARRYEHYRSSPPPGPVVAIEVTRWSGWAAR